MEINTGKFIGKLIVEGQIQCKTGLHIGASNDTTEIGSMDNPVVRDPLTREPYIPGSSVKGKLRSLLEKSFFAQGEGIGEIDKYFNKSMRSGGNIIRHHECNEPTCPVCRLFGASSGGGIEESRPARLIVEDCFLNEQSKEILENIDTGLFLTEQKSENTLDRITSAANPRQQERVPRGSIFEMGILYTADLEADNENFQSDVLSIFTCLRLLQDDYLGGSGSRGYGRVGIKEIEVSFRPRQYYVEGKGEKVFRQESEEGLLEFAQRLLKALKAG